MSFFGVQLNAQANRLIYEFRLQLCRAKFMPNFRTIYRNLSEYDPEISGLIQSVKFEKALNNNGLFCKKYQLQILQKVYRNEQGLINWFQFMNHLRQPMGPLRRQLVQNIFDYMDQNKKGKLTPDQLLQHFNFKEIQTYKTGKKTKQMVFNDFLSMLSMPQDFITRQQFISFYDDCNINFPHNDIFYRFVSEMWNYTPEKIIAAKQSDLKAASKAVRFALIQKSQATKDQFLLQKLFSQYDINKNKQLGTYELDVMIKKLGLKVEPYVVQPFLIRIDKNKSGYIEYEDFKEFLFSDPYPL